MHSSVIVIINTLKIFLPTTLFLLFLSLSVIFIVSPVNSPIFPHSLYLYQTLSLDYKMPSFIYIKCDGTNKVIGRIPFSN